MSDPELRTSVRWRHGLFSSETAMLTLTAGRISLLVGTSPRFDAPLREVSRIYWPDPFHLRFGLGHLQLDVAGTTYRLAFPAMKGFAGPTTGTSQRNLWRRALEDALREGA